jgi:hypothetical protein
MRIVASPDSDDRLAVCRDAAPFAPVQYDAARDQDQRDVRTAVTTSALTLGHAGACNKAD